MASKTPKSSISVTAGKNKAVNNVIKFEDLVQQLKQGAPVAARKKGGAKKVSGDDLASIEQLAGDLEKHLRKVRRASPDEPANAPRRKRKA